MVVRSEWSFVTSAGGDLSIATPVVHVGVNATGGALWVQRDSESSPRSLKYGGVGGSVGLSLVPFPGNFSFSIPQMPSSGRIYRLPFAGSSLSLDELTGAFALIEVSGDVGPGGSGCVMFIGGSTVAALSTVGPLGSMLEVALFLATCNACVCFGGMTATLIPVNASVNCYLGGIIP
ncbi:MAG: hypothetical protein AB9873_04875 [Syntrophobacteraceae bacterium]